MAITDLVEYLNSLPTNSRVDAHHLEELLIGCWTEFDGSAQEGMSSNKLKGRMENVEWNSPELIFKIERHGGTVLGSTRADIQKWTLNVFSKTATCVKVSHRQLKPMAERINLKEISDEIAQIILNHGQDGRIKWLSDYEVKVNIGVVFPQDSGFKETIKNRRKKFHEYLDTSLTTHGWKKISANHYCVLK